MKTETVTVSENSFLDMFKRILWITTLRVFMVRIGKMLIMNTTTYFCERRKKAFHGAFIATSGMVTCGEGVMYLTSLGRPTEIDLQLGKACCPCSR